MSWIKEVCVNTLSGGSVRVAKRAFGISFFTEVELEKITNLKRLALDKKRFGNVLIGSCRSLVGC
jgi:hypothetical protein